ncbi:unnamed protein product, partial [Musa hybrid cultivar]
AKPGGVGAIGTGKWSGGATMKVIDKIRGAAEGDGRTVFSFEFFPPKTEEGVENLFERMDRMVAHNPNFCDITWGAGGSTADLTLDIANRMQNMICVETMMHLTCTNMPVEKIDHALDTIKANGIQNVLALRGDPPHGQDKFVQVAGGFACALDLVQHIRAKYGDYFGITVAGYPEAHPDMIQGDGGATQEAYNNDLAYLKRKVDAGADLIITQLFYDTDIFLKFVNDCHQIGITCPIVPGIMPINNYKGFLRMTGFCKTKIPPEITAALDPIKDNEDAVRAYGVHLGTEMCKKILSHGIKTLHLYTLNMEKSALAILMNLGLIEESKVSRSLPWRRPANVFRVKEDVRPIFWANRPKSYISRTVGWDQYPHGRWGDSNNPSYGALTDYQFMRPRSRDKKLQEEWATPLKSVDDINERFMKFCLGKLRSSPWSELDGLQPETKIINEQLSQVNLKGFLTINSQPPVNGEKSDSPAVGWGGPGGYVYQKAKAEVLLKFEAILATSWSQFGMIQLLGSTELIRHLIILLALLGVLFACQYKAQPPISFASTARSLDALLQDYAYRAIVRPRTGISYNGTVPSNLTGIKIAAIRLRSGSLRKRGVHSFKEFSIPVGVVVQPYVRRLVLVYQSLGNWSSVYYPLPGYSYLTPVLGLLAYDAANLSATNLPELNIVVLESPISINFTNVTPVPSGTIARCVWFGLDGSPYFRDLVSSNVCSTYRQGHFSIVVNSSEIAPSPAPSLTPRPRPSPGGFKGSNKSKVWKIVVGAVGGFVALVFLALLVYCMQRYKQKKKVEQMEQHANAGVSLQTASVGDARVPVASVTRTQPVLENELVA